MRQIGGQLRHNAIVMLTARDSVRIMDRKLLEDCWGINQEHPMTQLFTTFRRAALLACALGYGIAAHAASVTVDAGTACTAFSWNPATSTLSCQVSTDCVVTGANSAVVNTSVTLTASCPTSTTITWDGTGTSGCSGATCDVTSAATGSQTYGATGNSSARGTKAVNWTSNSVVPGGCTLTASPSSGTAASNVTLPADCSSGTDPIPLDRLSPSAKPSRPLSRFPLRRLPMTAKRAKSVTKLNHPLI
jgi:hypothetical protein